MRVYKRQTTIHMNKRESASDLEPKVAGWTLRARDIPLLQIVETASRKQHLLKIVTPGGIRPIWFTSKSKTIIKAYKVVGDLHEDQPKEIKIHHQDDFCQGCKIALRRIIGVQFTHLMTRRLPLLDPRQPKTDRLMTFVVEASRH